MSLRMCLAEEVVQGSGHIDEMQVRKEESMPRACCEGFYF